MGQNVSSAVMAQRQDRDDLLDYFPTPPWATRALCQVLEPDVDMHAMTCWEPACGEGYMARPLAERFRRVVATDIVDYRQTWPAQDGVRDFLMGDAWGIPDGMGERPHWIITNPPFAQAEAFATRALTLAQDGVALLLRLQFLEGVTRWQRLFSRTPPWTVAPFAERVPMFKGRCSGRGSTATAYAWFIWRADSDLISRVQWIAPCRAALEVAGDYDLGGDDDRR